MRLFARLASYPDAYHIRISPRISGQPPIHLLPAIRINQRRAQKKPGDYSPACYNACFNSSSAFLAGFSLIPASFIRRGRPGNFPSSSKILLATLLARSTSISTVSFLPLFWAVTGLLLVGLLLVGLLLVGLLLVGLSLVVCLAVGSDWLVAAGGLVATDAW